MIGVRQHVDRLRARTPGRWARLRQSSSVSFQRLSGSRSRARIALELLVLRDVQPELDQHHSLAGQGPLEARRSRSYARRHAARSRTPPPARRARARTTSDRARSSRPSRAGRARSATGSDGAAPGRSAPRTASTLTCRGSSGPVSRRIAPPLPDASQPSNTTHSGGPSAPSPIRPAACRRSASSRRCSGLQPLQALRARRVSSYRSTPSSRATRGYSAQLPWLIAAAIRATARRAGCRRTGRRSRFARPTSRGCSSPVSAPTSSRSRSCCRSSTTARRRGGARCARRRFA